MLAAIDERLSLMPFVAIAKRRASLPLAIPKREEYVVEAAVDAVRAAAERAGVEPPAASAARGLFVAQIEAGKEVQRAALTDPDYRALETLPDLKTELRPALLRIGERIAQLAVALPSDLESARVAETARRELRSARLSEASLRAIAAAIGEISRTTAPTD